MAALIPALIKLLMSRRGGGGGGGYSKGGYSKGGYSGREPKPQRSPEEYSMELLDKNARKEMIQQDDSPGSGRGASDALTRQLMDAIEQQRQQMEAITNDLKR